MKVRPHPDRDWICLSPRLRPQPQERENRSPHSGQTIAFGFRARSEWKGQEAGVALKASKSTSKVVAPSLSPGERAGVRASVRSNPFSRTMHHIAALVLWSLAIGHWSLLPAYAVAPRLTNILP